jgi:hypothetical protein
MTKRTDYREYTTVDLNGQPVMIKMATSKKGGVPWEHVDLLSPPMGLQKRVTRLGQAICSMHIR